MLVTVFMCPLSIQCTGSVMKVTVNDRKKKNPLANPNSDINMT